MANESSPRKSRTQEEMGREIDDLRSQLQNLALSVSNTAGRQLRSTQATLETTIRDNPLSAVAIAAAIGFLYAMIRR